VVAAARAGPQPVPVGISVRSYIVKRLGRGALTFFLAVTLTFVLLRLMPGDITTALVDPRMPPEARAELLRSFGLDQPTWRQYLLYLKSVFVDWNLGLSFASRAPVTKLLISRLPWTVLLGATSLLLTVGIGIPMGIVAAVRRNSVWDRLINAFAIAGYSIFIPWLGITLLYWFGYRVPVFPIGGASTPGLTGWPLAVDVLKHMVLPVITLTTIVLANYVLFVRTSMIDALREDYITTARSKGLSGRVVIYKHALKNALLPTITVLGLQLGFMVGGAILTETIFAWPGVGRLIFTAVTGQDYPVLQGTFLILAVTVVIASIFTDMAYGYLDPRIKYD